MLGSERGRMLCRDHGEAAECFVCIHLRKGNGRGFHAQAPPDGGPMREARCRKCEFWATRPPALANAYRFLFGERIRVCEHCLVLIRIGNEE